MSIFPLPLVPFEHYMLADDSVEYPMTFFMRMQFRGRFQRDRAQRALRDAVNWHLLLSAHIHGSVKDPTSCLHWERCDPVNLPIVWQTVEAPIEFAGGPRIDLSHNPGLRTWFREAENSTELLCQFHHACCDGLGAIQFLETFLEIYGELEKPQPPPEWETRYALRHLIADGERGWSWTDLLGRIGQGLKRLGRYFKTRPAPLALPPACLVSGFAAIVDAVPMVSHFFDEGGTNQIRAAAKRWNVSVNALLMSELFLALDEWNRNFSPEHTGRPLRIVMPVNLRSGGRERLPAFNAVSLAFIDRQSPELGDAARLLQSIEREAGEAKSLRRKMVLLTALRWLGRFHNGICGRLQSCSCLGSAVFSNLGILFSASRLLGADRLVHCGDLVLTRFEAAPPVRRNTLAGFATSMYGNALTVSLGYDPHSLTPPDARAMLELYVRRLEACALGTTVARVTDAVGAS